MENKEKIDIILLHSGGQTAYNSAAIRAYGSVEALIESDLLPDVQGREKSLWHLWEAANPDIQTDDE